jgi:hypothetical protein
MADPFYTRHRGPYQLQITRSKPLTSKAKLKVEVETLTGTVDGPDVESEARALLDDPRDSILSVSVWSIKEQQHVMTFSKGA